MDGDLIRVLLVEDEPAHATLVQRYLGASSSPRFEVTWVECLAPALKALESQDVDVVLLDLGLPDSVPSETLPRVLEATQAHPVVVLTTSEEQGEALRAVQAGAQDHLPKARVSSDLLARSLRYAIERHRSEMELKRLNATLERRVAERSSVAEKRSQMLRQLAVELTQAEQRERNRLAQFLHDDLQQMLVATRMRLNMLQRQVQEETQAGMIAQALDLLDQSIRASRSLTRDMSPSVLNDRGLEAAIEALTRRMQDQHGLRVDLSFTGDSKRISPDMTLMLFDAARELLFNVVKHAGVNEARVTLDCDNPDAVTLTVCDQGEGFDPAALRERGVSDDQFGLFSIRERFEAVGGHVEIDSALGRGTTTRITAPYELHRAEAR